MALFVAVVTVIAPYIWLVPPFVARYMNIDGELLSISQALNMTAVEESTCVVFCLKYLPVGAMGIILAAMLSATMSTISSNFNVYAGVLTEDIIKQLFMKNATEKQLLLIGRLVTLLQGVIVITLAILMSQHEGGVFQLMLDFSGIVILPAGIPIFMGIAVMLMSLLPALDMTGRTINFAVGFLMILFGALVLYVSKLAKTKRERALREASAVVPGKLDDSS